MKHVIRSFLKTDTDFPETRNKKTTCFLPHCDIRPLKIRNHPDDSRVHTYISKREKTAETNNKFVVL
jgi:hypothetical protein